MIVDKATEAKLAEMIGTTEVRIAWKIPSYGKGHGDWIPEVEEGVLQLQVHCLNRHYGAGTHWIQHRAYGGWKP